MVGRNDSPNKPRSPRPFLGVMFECCNVYGRIHRTHTGTHYAGHCPRCLKSVRVAIGQGGTGQRFFRAR